MDFIQQKFYSTLDPHYLLFWKLFNSNFNFTWIFLILILFEIYNCWYSLFFTLFSFILIFFIFTLLFFLFWPFFTYIWVFLIFLMAFSLFATDIASMTHNFFLFFGWSYCYHSLLKIKLFCIKCELWSRFMYNELLCCCLLTILLLHLPLFRFDFYWFWGNIRRCLKSGYTLF